MNSVFALIDACTKGSLQEVAALLPTYKSLPIVTLDEILSILCKNENIDIIHLFLESNYKNIHDVMMVASQMRNSKLITRLIDYEMKMKLESMRNMAFLISCKTGDMPTLTEMIHHGSYEWHKGLTNALEGGHKNVAEFLFTYCQFTYLQISNINSWKWESFLESATKGGNIEIVKLIIQKMKDASHDMARKIIEDNKNTLLQICSSLSYTDIALLFIDLGADNFTECLASVNFHDYTDIIKIMCEKGADLVCDALNRSCYQNNLAATKLLYDICNKRIIANKSVHEDQSKRCSVCCNVEKTFDTTKAFYHALGHFYDNVDIIVFLAQQESTSCDDIDTKLQYYTLEGKNRVKVLVERGFPVEKLNAIHSYDALIDDINMFKENVFGALDNVLLKELVGIVSGYVIF